MALGENLTGTPLLDGASFQAAFGTAARWLEANADAVNALNVFPVPDGDTGTNMALTLRSGVEAMDRCGDETPLALAQALAHGSLLGARGNSGVILSQWLAGLAEGLESGLRAALQLASRRSYGAVSQPVEGTILTVMREAADHAWGDIPETVLVSALEEARAALVRTPDLLPVLREAGVVDAGGQGLVLILEGAVAGLRRTDLGPVRDLGGIAPDWLSGHAAGASGYCTEFVIQGAALSTDLLRVDFATLGDSLLVVGGTEMVRVHLHTGDPGVALSKAVSMGSLHRIKIDNMAEQRATLATAAQSMPGLRRQTAPVVAVVAGEGLTRIFESLGAAVVPGGQSMNPSIGEMIEALRAVEAGSVLLLPNNPNVVAAAEQAAKASGKRVEVVPSKTVPQGLAALLAYNPELPFEQNVRAMAAALTSVITIEVTQAVRDASIQGVSVTRGQYLALVQRRPSVAANTPGEAVDRALDEMDPGSGYLITLYYGETVTQEEADGLARSLLERPDPPEVEVVWGGQPHYQYIASVER